MDGYAPPPPGGEQVERAFEFTGRWREFLPIALTNLLLMAATLGIYRFWATTRERRYLWSRTRVIDDRLEWSGTGKEMFLGFLMVLLLLIPMIVLLTVAFALSARGGTTGLVGGLMIFAVYGTFFYLMGVAAFRALRYRLSRTFWHGIRGGSDSGGWAYGWQWVWKTTAGYAFLAFLVPWSKTSLWNDRWNRMSFGRHQFDACADADGLVGRWMFVYLVPIFFFVLAAAVIGDVPRDGEPASPEVLRAIMVKTFLVVVVGFLAYSLVSLAFWAAYYRRVVETTSIDGLSFHFTAGTTDWVKLVLGHIGLVIVTLGVGMMFIRYRNWAFTVRHLEAHGLVDVDALLQSLARSPGEAEGFADAFDMGAI